MSVKLEYVDSLVGSAKGGRSRNGWRRLVMLLAYLCLAAALYSYVSGTNRSWVVGGRTSGHYGLRVGATITAVFLVGLGGLVLAQQHNLTSPAAIPVGTLVLGAVAYTVGIALWIGRLAYACRLTGWIAIVTALSVPSTLTLAMPLAALLVVTVSRVGSTGTVTDPVLGDLTWGGDDPGRSTS